MILTQNGQSELMINPKTGEFSTRTLSEGERSDYEKNQRYELFKRIDSENEDKNKALDIMVFEACFDLDEILEFALKTDE